MRNEMVSIIVPVYNAEKYLSECIDSILSSTYHYLEVLLVDDGSRDSSGSICDQYAAIDSRVRVIHQPNGGVTAARKMGVEMASGEWITFVDADDKLVPDGIAQLMEFASRDDSLDMVEGQVYNLYPNGDCILKQTPIISQGPTICSSPDYLDLLWLNRNVVHGGPFCKVIRHSLFVDTCALEIDRSITYGEDILMLTLLATKMSKVAIIPAGVYVYRRDIGGSASSDKKSFQYWSDYLQYIDNRVPKDKIENWDGIWMGITRETYSRIVHCGLILDARIPSYFQGHVLPMLCNIRNLSFIERLYVRVLSLPYSCRRLIIPFLHLAYRIKNRYS